MKRSAASQAPDLLTFWVAAGRGGPSASSAATTSRSGVEMMMVRSDDGVLAGITVLVVEDMADSREAFARLLALEGADVLVASTANEALEIVRAHAVDVLMTDLGLPDMPGDVLISAVNAESKRRPKIVAVTGYGEPHVTRARRAGADLVMMKPVAWNRLIDFIAASTPAAA